MNRTPKSNRLHIAIFGRTNVGKSSLLNMIAGQDIAITSHIAGTTTDVVEKSMELLPIGPVVFLDTAGLDDISDLADKRIKKTKKIFDRSEIIILVIEPNKWTDYEEKIVSEAKYKKIPTIIVVNKIDIIKPYKTFVSHIRRKANYIISISCMNKINRNSYINEIKNDIKRVLPDDFIKPLTIVGDLVSPGGIAILVTPIDLEAPKGRLILPQVQTIRDLLDNDATAIVVKETGLVSILKNLVTKPDIVIGDSQVVKKMCNETPINLHCTTFSILFVRNKGDLIESARGVAHIKNLKPGDKVLIAEACSHHPLADDIGRVKIPKWLEQYTGGDLDIEVYSGRDYPENINDYKLVIHCGGCMLTRKEMLNRTDIVRESNVPITNYGVAISYLQGVLERTLLPFPSALIAYKKEMQKIR